MKKQRAIRRLTGAEVIAHERKRQQVKKGYDAAHDAEHAGGELAYAAIARALHAIAQTQGVEGSDATLACRCGGLTVVVPPLALAEMLWPDDWGTMPPEDPIRSLGVAGALIAAEIDRLLLERRDG